MRSLSQHQASHEDKHLHSLASKLLQKKQERTKKNEILKIIKKRQNMPTSFEYRNQHRESNRSQLKGSRNNTTEWRARSAMRNNSNYENSLILGADNGLSIFEPKTNNFLSLNEQSPLKIQRQAHCTLDNKGNVQ